VQRDQGEHKALWGNEDEQLVTNVDEERKRGGEDTHPQILHQVVEHAQALWVLTILYVHQRADLCSLKTKVSGRWGDGARRRAYFECDVVVSDADLQLLFADDVFLWPVCVVFPIERVSGRRSRSFVLRAKGLHT
jgi:hypothetical protein